MRSSSPAEALTLVTVSHDSRPELVRLIESASRRLPGAELIVVDSGSSDGGPAAGRELGARVVELGENVGYGRAANEGVALAGRPVTVVLNPDVELIDGSLAALAGAARAQPERILAPLVLLPDGSRQDTAQHAPISWAALVSALVPPAALPPRLRTAAEPWRSDRPRRVAWAVGCCLAASTETLRGLGPFDERIFLYGEDLELGLRAGELGVETWFWPQARIVHHRSASTDRVFGSEPFERLARQRRRVVEERLGRGRRRLDDWAQLATFADRMALKALLRRPHERERRQLAALRAVRRGDQGAGGGVAERSGRRSLDP
jgi:GT2 family glycosyltransferase